MVTPTPNVGRCLALRREGGTAMAEEPIVLEIFSDYV